LRPRGTLRVDVGTSSTTGVLFDGEVTVVCSPEVSIREPDPAVRTEYDELYSRHRELYPSTTATAPALVDREQRTVRTATEEFR
jgi:uncharacterized iron-regulated membrane protein